MRQGDPGTAADLRPDSAEDATRDRVLLATLPHVAFDGWSGRALRNGLADAGLPAEAGALIFPGGPAEMITHWSNWADARMVEAMQPLDVQVQRLHERITAAVRRRIEVDAPYREAVRRTLSWLALPANTPLALRLGWETVDAAWYACGDTSTDFGFYSKRVSLAAVFGSTLLSWLDDESEDFVETWAFLGRRIEDVMRVPRLQARLQTDLRRFRLPWPRRLDAPRV